MSLLLTTTLAILSAKAPRECNVMDYGAKGDNKTEDTAAVIAALLACNGKGGGTVVVGAGTFLIRPVQLPSHTDLELQPGSTLTAWSDRYTWPNSTDKPCDFAREGSGCCTQNLPCCVPQKESMLWATNATNVTIRGGGVIDGNANFNDWHRGAGNVSADGKHVSPAYGDYWHMCRPRMIELRYTDGATINNVTIQNSIMFNVHTAHVNRLRIANVTVHSLGPNTDGFNVAGTDMHIVDSTVCNNDDCIPVNGPTNGLVVERVSCICQWGGGFVPMVGDDDTSWGADCQYRDGKPACSARGDIVNVTFKDSMFNHTSTAIIMKSMPMFKGSIKNVTYENIVLHNVRTGICINTASQSCYNRDDARSLSGTGATPTTTSSRLDVGSLSSSRPSLNQLGFMNVEGVTIKNVTGINVDLAGFINCPKGDCSGLSVEDVTFKGAKPYYCDGVFSGESKRCTPPTCPLD